jgi:hypothetical protein
VLEIHHRREGVGIGVAETGVELTVITRDDEHCSDLVAALEAQGYPLDNVMRRSA